MFAVCDEIGKLIETMAAYTERLSALWLLVIDEFAKSATGVYEKVFLIELTVLNRIQLRGRCFDVKREDIQVESKGELI